MLSAMTSRTEKRMKIGICKQDSSYFRRKGRSTLAQLLRNGWAVGLVGFTVMIIIQMGIPTTMAATNQTRTLSVAPAGVVPTMFKHPGLLDTKGHLDYVKQQVTKGAEPWLSAFNKARDS